jgi:probable HAF family extracellular repeat protein
MNGFTRIVLIATLAIHALFFVRTNAGHAQPAFFMGLGDLPGGPFSSDAFDISADGSVVVGWSRRGDSSDQREAFRWTRETGMVGLGTIGTGSRAGSISADGTTIVGWTGENMGQNIGPHQAFRWKQQTGMQLLPEPADLNESSTSGVTADGAVIVGNTCCSLSVEGLRWTESGYEDMSAAIGLNQYSLTDISADGAFLTGIAYLEPDFLSSGRTGFVWSQNGGLELLRAPAPNDQFKFEPLAISADGSVVVGSGFFQFFGDGGAAMWSRQTGVVWIQGSSIDGTYFDIANDVSSDGTIVIGRGSITGPARIWDAAHGTRDLGQVLRDEYGLGAAMAGWTLRDARAISANNRTIVGSGRNPLDFLEGWIAYLGTPVPEPSALLLAVLVILPGIFRRRPYRGRNMRLRAA